MVKTPILEENVSSPNRLLSWDELHNLQDLAGVQKVASEWLPGVGYFVTVTGTRRGIQRVKKALTAK